MPDSPTEPAGDGLAAIPSLWGTTIETRVDRPEALKIRERLFADAVLVEIAAPPATVTQDGSTGDSPHRFHMVLPDQGHGTYHWARGTATQRPDEIVLLDITEPSRLVSTVDSRLIRLSFPEECIAPFLPSRDACAVLHLPAREGLMKVIAQHARALACEADRLDRVAQHALLAHLCGLLGLAIETETSSRPVRHRGGPGRLDRLAALLRCIPVADQAAKIPLEKFCCCCACGDVGKASALSIISSRPI